MVLQDRYRIDGPLGSGAMGSVFRAHDLRLDTACALKQVTLHGLPPEARREALDRITAEARLLSRLAHQGLPRVHDVFSEGGRHYLVEDLVDGISLDAEVETRGRPGLHEQEVREIALAILDILEYLHSQQPPIVHRDVKPGNIMRERSSGRIVLIDFGIARQFATSTHTSIGTWGYAPPEQYRGRAEPRSDLYALGASMHHLLSGRGPEVPFHFEPIGRLVPSVSPRLRDVIQIALAALPEGRYPHAAAMRDALRGHGPVLRRVVPLQTPTPRPAPPRPVSAPDRASAPTVEMVPPPRRGLHIVGRNERGYEEAENGTDGSILIHIPGGAATIGSNHAEDERPPHSVIFGDFWINKVPITNNQFRRFLSATGYAPDDRGWEGCARSWGEQAPVAGIAYADALAYCRWAELRLPTEEEWEYAARGPDGRRFPWGNAWDDTRCRHDLYGASRGAMTVGSYPEGASPFGCLDMVGNVPEWTASQYARYNGSKATPQQVLRGGSWNEDDPVLFRCARRTVDNGKQRAGFRCAL
jgi:formylglycine-generating enzyme required for sulfatase activity